jgi:PAS domain-containing protein
LENLQKKAEGKLFESVEIFRKLSANAPGLIYQFTRRGDGTYAVPVASDGIKDIFGCSPEDVRNDFTPIRKVIYPDDLDMLIKNIETSAKNLSLFNCEYRVQIPGKQIRWINNISKPEKLTDGSVTWYGFASDVTKHKQMELDLKEKLEEIEKINKLMVARELKMAQMKSEKIEAESKNKAKSEDK